MASPDYPDGSTAGLHPQAVGPAGEHLDATLAQAQGGHEDDVAWLGLDATGWVSVAMLILLGIMLWQRVPKRIGAMLDQEIARVRASLAEAEGLRREAETLLAEYRAKADQAARDAQDILTNARLEADEIVANARRQADLAVERRTRMAEDRIAAAERAAEQELRARAADLATEAARRLILSESNPDRQGRLTDAAIADLDRRLH